MYPADPILRDFEKCALLLWLRVVEKHYRLELHGCAKIFNGEMSLILDIAEWVDTAGTRATSANARTTTARSKSYYCSWGRSWCGGCTLVTKGSS